MQRNKNSFYAADSLLGHAQDIICKQHATAMTTETHKHSLVIILDAKLYHY